MSSVPKRRLEALSKQLVEGIPDAGQFENIPKIRKASEDSPGHRVQGKVAIVTGANSAIGIGRATVHQLAQHGAKAIYICDWMTENLETHRRELKELYPNVETHAVKLDVGDEEAVKKVVDDVIEKYGRLDIMFANAGVVGTHGMFDAIDAKQFMNTVRVNSLGVFLCAKYAAIAMKKTSSEKKYSGGSIIATASTAGIRSNAGSTDYSATKASVISIAQTMAFQLTGTGIRINAICPGIIETGMTKIVYDAARTRGTEKKIGQLCPLSRGGVADEIARVALFLASEDSSYVTGQAWAVDGGLSAGHPYVPGRLA